MKRIQTLSPSTTALAGLLGAALFLLAPAARGEEWPILGSRALGMGGAGVAVARGGAAIYWNPASLARGGRVSAPAAADLPAESPMVEASEERVRWNGGFGVSAMFAFPGDTLRNIDVLHDDLKALNVENFENKLNTGTPLTEQELQTALRIIGTDIPALDQPGQGVLVELVAGPSFQVGRFGFAALATVFGAVTAQADFTNLAFGNEGIDFLVGPGQDRSSQLSSSGQSLADDLVAGGGITQEQAEEIVFQAESAGVNTSDPQVRSIVTNVVEDTVANEGGSSDNFVTNNQSGAVQRGILLQELVVGYGLPIGDWLALGVTVKAMHAFTSSQTFVIKDIPDAKDMIENALDFENVEGSFNFGTDAGVLITPAPWLALGVTGRNLNRPAFDREDGGHMVIDPNARAGLALFPTPWLTLAADVDLFHNHSEVLPGHRSQVVGGGAQFDFRFIAIRAGISKNLLDEEEEVLLHGGLALRIGFFSLEAAAAMTPELQAIEANTAEVPERAGASLTFGFNMDF